MNLPYFVGQQSSTPSKLGNGKATTLISIVDSSQQWILDSNASHHMGSIKEKFICWSLVLCSTFSSGMIL
jgi:hypothetical protein